jgi:tetratricopeptide (TPR) repeat protein
MTSHAELVIALRLHHAGDLDQASRLYEAILSRDAEHADALHFLGVLRQQQGLLAQALELGTRAVALRPGEAQFHANLAETYRALGQFEPAVAHGRTALQLRRGYPEAQNNLGLALRASGRLQEAIDCYAAAIRLNPHFAQAHANLGMALRQAGRLPEAVPWLERATQLEPSEPAYWGYLADASSDLDRYSEAITCYERLIVLEPTKPLHFSNLGWLLRRAGCYDEARGMYEAALRIQPGFPEAMIGMGGLMEELGLMNDAQAWFRRVIAIHPADTVAAARLARTLQNQLSDHDLGDLKERVAHPDLSEAARAPMLFALANVLDARGDYAEAATFMRRANAAVLAENRRRSRAYQISEHERLISDLIAAFQPECFARFAGAGLQTRRPVFIFGLPRSGTSLLEQILSSHSQVHGAGEINLGRLDFESIPTIVNRSGSPLVGLADLSAEGVYELGSRHEARLVELGRGAARVVDKMTDNYLYLGLLAILFPNASFVHSRRDLRDVAVSCLITDFRAMRWTNHDRDIIHRFEQYLRLMDHWRTVLPAPIHEIDYEDTVNDLEAVSRRLVAACGLDWEPACLDFHQTKRPVKTSSLAQVRQPIYKNSIGRWRHYEQELGELYSALAERTSGYPGGIPSSCS